MNAHISIELFNAADVIATSTPAVVYCTHNGGHALVAQAMGYNTILGSYQSYIDNYYYDAVNHTLTLINSGNMGTPFETAVGQYYYYDNGYHLCGNVSHGI